jgi:hypothetical protein
MISGMQAVLFDTKDAVPNLCQLDGAKDDGRLEDKA